MRMSSADMQSCTAGRWHGVPPQMIGGVSTDTRHLHCGDAFVALRGPNFNGHAFAEDAIQAGATTLIGDLEGVQSWQDIDVPQLEVADTLQAYGDIAGKWRAKIPAKVVAITGSYGKTTLRSMLEHVLNRHGVRVAATHANNNNLVGVPQTLLAIDEQAEVALVECGISERGEMCRLAAMVRPDVAVITGVAEAHAEGLGGIVEVASEKAILLDYMTNEACAVLGDGVAGLLRDTGLLSDTNRNTVILDMESDADSIVKWQMSGRMVTLIRGTEEPLAKVVSGDLLPHSGAILSCNFGKWNHHSLATHPPRLLQVALNTLNFRCLSPPVTGHRMRRLPQQCWAGLVSGRYNLLLKRWAFGSR